MMAGFVAFVGCAALALGVMTWVCTQRGGPWTR